MTPSDGRLPSLPPPFCASFECARGETGLRSFAVSLLLVTTNLCISIGAEACHGLLLALTITDIDVLACVVTFLRARSAHFWVHHSKFGQQICHADAVRAS